MFSEVICTYHLEVVLVLISLPGTPHTLLNGLSGSWRHGIPTNLSVLYSGLRPESGVLLFLISQVVLAMSRKHLDT